MYENSDRFLKYGILKEESAKIFKGFDKKLSKNLILKVQSKKRSGEILYEARVYLYIFQKAPRNKEIPQIMYFRDKDETLILEEKGLSLNEVFESNGRKFSLKMLIEIAHQIIDRLQFLHTLSFVHRAIHPSHFVFGKNPEKSRIYMISLGHSKKYLTIEGSHITCKRGRTVLGNQRFQSINSTMGVEQSRRDDIESLGFMLVYFLKGSLPWMDLRAETPEKLYSCIIEKKIETSIESLITGLPEEIGQFISYARGLKFEEKPDYLFLHGLLDKVYKRAGFTQDP